MQAIFTSWSIWKRRDLQCNLNLIAYPQIGQIEYSFRKPKLTPTQIESRTRKVLFITVLTTFDPHTYDAEAVYGHLGVLKYLKSEGMEVHSTTCKAAAEGDHIKKTVLV